MTRPSFAIEIEDFVKDADKIKDLNKYATEETSQFTEDLINLFKHKELQENKVISSLIEKFEKLSKDLLITTFLNEMRLFSKATNMLISINTNNALTMTQRVLERQKSVDSINIRRARIYALVSTILNDK